MASWPTPTKRPLLFTTGWCPYCARLKSGLASSPTGYDEIDVEVDDAAAQFVMSVNNGNRVVPTVLFPDGSTLTNPRADAVTERLAAVAG